MNLLLRWVFFAETDRGRLLLLREIDLILSGDFFQPSGRRIHSRILSAFDSPQGPPRSFDRKNRITQRTPRYSDMCRIFIYKALIGANHVFGLSASSFSSFLVLWIFPIKWSGMCEVCLCQRSRLLTIKSLILASRATDIDDRDDLIRFWYDRLRHRADSAQDSKKRPRVSHERKDKKRKETGHIHIPADPVLSKRRPLDFPTSQGPGKRCCSEETTRCSFLGESRGDPDPLKRRLFWWFQRTRLRPADRHLRSFRARFRLTCPLAGSLVELIEGRNERRRVTRASFRRSSSSLNLDPRRNYGSARYSNPGIDDLPNWQAWGMYHSWENLARRQLWPFFRYIWSSPW